MGVCKIVCRGLWEKMFRVCCFQLGLRSIKRGFVSLYMCVKEYILIRKRRLVDVNTFWKRDNQLVAGVSVSDFSDFVSSGQPYDIKVTTIPNCFFWHKWIFYQWLFQLVDPLFICFLIKYQLGDFENKIEPFVWLIILSEWTHDVLSTMPAKIKVAQVKMIFLSFSFFWLVANYLWCFCQWSVVVWGDVCRAIKYYPIIFLCCCMLKYVILFECFAYLYENYLICFLFICLTINIIISLVSK